MKILMVISGMKSGGAERVMATLCNDLVKRNEVILTILRTSESDYELCNKIKVVTGNIKNKNLPKAVNFVSKQIDFYKPDIILSFMTKNNIVSAIARQISHYKCPVVISERGNPYKAKKIYCFMRNRLYPLVDGCVFQTTLAQKYYKNILKYKTVVIRNPLNSDFCVENVIKERKKKIVTVGRLTEEKNQKMLINAFKKISEKYPDYYLEIYGDGPLKDKLQKQINDLKLDDKAKIMGRKKNIKDYIKDSNIFVLTSNSEGMPNALLEAMALGIPSISTDCPVGGPADIIKNQDNGILIPMNDENKLITNIEKIITNKEFANTLSKNSLKVIKDFDQEKICHEWEDYLKYVMLNYRNKD